MFHVVAVEIHSLSDLLFSFSYTHGMLHSDNAINSITLSTDLFCLMTDVFSFLLVSYTEESVNYRQILNRF